MRHERRQLVIKAVAFTQVGFGLAGLVFTARSVSILLDRGAVLSVPILLGAILPFGLAVAAGVQLRRGGMLGEVLTVANLVLQVPIIITTVFSFFYTTGVSLEIWAGDQGLGFNAFLGNRVHLGVSEDLPHSGIGINVVALGLLILFIRAMPDGERSTTGAETGGALEEMDEGLHPVPPVRRDSPGGERVRVTPDSGSSRLLPPTWLTLLGWIYLIAFAFRSVADLAQGTLGYNPLVVTLGFGRHDSDPVVTWWALVHLAAEVTLAIGCIAVLLRDRDLLWFAVFGGWAVALLQCCDSFVGIFHLRFAIPLSAPVYAVLAWRSASLLRSQRPAPPGALETR